MHGWIDRGGFIPVCTYMHMHRPMHTDRCTVYKLDTWAFTLGDPALTLVKADRVFFPPVP